MFFTVAALACLLLVPALLAGVPVQVVAAAAVRRPTLLRFSLVPRRLVVLVVGLFFVVEALGPFFLDAALRPAAAGHGRLVIAAVVSGSANAVNNLPADLALERVVPEPDLLAVLIDVNLAL